MMEIPRNHFKGNWNPYRKPLRKLKERRVRYCFYNQFNKVNFGMITNITNKVDNVTHAFESAMSDVNVSNNAVLVLL